MGGRVVGQMFQSLPFSLLRLFALLLAFSPRVEIASNPPHVLFSYDPQFLFFPLVSADLWLPLLLIQIPRVSVAAMQIPRVSVAAKHIPRENGLPMKFQGKPKVAGRKYSGKSFKWGSMFSLWWYVPFYTYQADWLLVDHLFADIFHICTQFLFRIFFCLLSAI